MELKEKLAELRGQKGLTQDELAQALGVTRQAVSKWERGIIAPATMNLAALGRLYGVPLDELVNGEQQCEEPPATAVAVEPETAPASRGFSPPRLVGAIALASILLLMAVASIITIASAIFKEPEMPKDSLTITNQDDMEWEYIDWDDLTPHEWTWKISE